MQEIKIKKYISESEESLTPLIDLLNTEGTHLVVAPTGAGKTNAIIESSKELGKRNNKVLYVMACPNKVQNLQNANKYKIKSIVAGTTKEDLKGVSVVSMVYDKADMVLEYVKENNLNLVLIIDEAHQLVDSSMYRKKALQSLGNLKSYAD
ncbi:DEAD/DEAH box helicase family protein, partial [Clostridium perfringens]